MNITFNVTKGSQTVIATGTGKVTPAEAIVFASQPGCEYYVSTVTSVFPVTVPPSFTVKLNQAPFTGAYTGPSALATTGIQGTATAGFANDFGEVIFDASSTMTIQQAPASPAMTIVYATPSQTLQEATTYPLTCTGTVALTANTLTTTSFSIPPNPGDLVRVLTGTGITTPSPWLYVTSVHIGSGSNPSWVVADTSYTLPSRPAGYTFEVVVRTVVYPTSGTATATFSGTTLTDNAATTFSPALLGYTVLVTDTSGSPTKYYRRQIICYTAPPLPLPPAPPIPQTLTLDHALPNGTYSYVIVNSLNSYNGPLVARIQEDVTKELSSLGNELVALQNFFDDIFSVPLIASAQGLVPTQAPPATLTTLTDMSVHFLDLENPTANYVWVQSGPNMGVYQVGSVTDDNDLVVTTPFPVAVTHPSHMSYTIVSAFGCSFPSMQLLYSILTVNAQFQKDTQNWIKLLTAQDTYGVHGDSSAFVTDIQATDILDNSVSPNTGRIADIGVAATATTVGTGRLGLLTNLGVGSLLPTPASLGPPPTPETPSTNGIIATVENILSGAENLYNTRYAWINGRINLQSGFLAQQVLSVNNRLTAQSNLVNQLLMLLAVQSGG